MELFDLNYEENYDKLCGEIFFTTKGRLAYFCTSCGRYMDHANFVDHLFKDCFKLVNNEYVKMSKIKISKVISEATTFCDNLQEDEIVKRQPISNQPDDNEILLQTNEIVEAPSQQVAEELYFQNIGTNDDSIEAESFEQQDYVYIENGENFGEYINFECLEDAGMNEEIQIVDQIEEDVDVLSDFIDEHESDLQTQSFLVSIEGDTTFSTYSAESDVIETNEEDVNLDDQPVYNPEENYQPNVNLKPLPPVVRQVRVRQKYFPTDEAKNQPEERKFKCRICGLAFKDNCNMNYHMRRHTDRKKFGCVDCDKRFFTSAEVRSHSRVHNKLSKNFLCPECGMAFLTNYNLQLHQKKRHTNQRDYICKICTKGFFILKDLKKHMASHSSERPYSCQLCDGKFKLPQGLKTHMKQHENKREHKCPYECNAAFNVKAALYSHIKTKHKENEK